ncbi:MAG TPA: heavy metal translocating P-type ATPase [Vicinamibacterales bacterium]|nr:heavy metal translocating P-type ATPase [Vicinamibacterales bacterium]
MALDPVCGMTVDPATARGGSFEHAGTTYYFCSPGCRQKFATDPDQWLKSGPKGMAPAVAPLTLRRVDKSRELSTPAKATFTCPMHPEVVQQGPGACPICGMALEPTLPSADEDTSELDDMTRRLWVAAALAAPLLVLAMTGMTDPWFLPSARTRQWLELLLATPVCLWAAQPFFERMIASIRQRHPNMFTLIGLGVAVAYGFSVVATVAPELFPATLRDHHGNVGVYFEAAAVIVALVLVGQVLELRARQHTGAAIRTLIGLAPATARRIGADGVEEDIPLAHVHLGDRLRVLPGTRVPVDGVVLEGGTHVDESMITGESIPVRKTPGDHVIGATMNGTGSLVMRADRVGAETLLSRIIALVAQAQRSRAPIQSLADRVSGYFVPAVIAVAAITFGVWSAIGPEPRLAYAIVNAVAVLIIACPCALGLATPMSIMVAAGRAASLGILFRNAEAIERLEKVDTLVVDKTGTLTAGKPTLTSVTWAEGFSEADVLGMAAAVERASEHPLAAAIVAGAAAKGLAVDPVEQFRAVVGEGAVGRVAGRDVAIGNAALMQTRAVDVTALSGRAEALRHDGQTVVFVASDGRAAGLLGISDPIRVSAPDAIRALHHEGLRVVMLTGDTHATAATVARKLGIDEVHADVRPDGKARLIADLQTSGRVVAMAGDGINDAPALATADVGIAMGTGTDVAIESAHVTLVKGDLGALIRAIRLSRQTLRNIRQNLFFAFVYNAAGVPIAAGVLYPVFGWLLSPMIAAAAMSVSSVSVIGNALRLRHVRV